MGPCDEEGEVWLGIDTVPAREAGEGTAGSRRTCSLKTPGPPASGGRCGPGTGFPDSTDTRLLRALGKPARLAAPPGGGGGGDDRPQTGPAPHHREPVRLCDGQPAGGDDVPSGDREALREARYEATLCPACQQRSGIPPFALRPQLYSSRPRRTIAEFYTVPVLCDFDDIRNCSHCRLHPGDRSCRTWEEARKGVAVLHREARRIARDVAEIPEATAGCAAILYEFCDGSVGYFALEAPPWREAGEVTELRRATIAGDGARHEMGGGTPDRVGMG